MFALLAVHAPPTKQVESWGVPGRLDMSGAAHLCLCVCIGVCVCVCFFLSPSSVGRPWTPGSASPPGLIVIVARAYHVPIGVTVALLSVNIPRSS